MVLWPGPSHLGLDLVLHHVEAFWEGGHFRQEKDSKVFPEDLIWGDCFRQKTCIYAGASQKHVEESKKNKVLKFFTVYLQTNFTWIILTVISLNLFAKHSTSSRCLLPLAVSTEGGNGGKNWGNSI